MMKRGIMIMALAAVVLAGCKTKERVVAVPEVHEHWHHTTDTVVKVDSVIERETTVVREVDSATMARYGVELKQAQRAWLIETDRMKRELSRLREAKRDTVVQRDSVPVPYPVEVEVPAAISRWQHVRMALGDAVLWGAVIAIFFWLRRRAWP